MTVALLQVLLFPTHINNIGYTQMLFHPTVGVPLRCTEFKWKEDSLPPNALNISGSGRVTVSKGGTSSIVRTFPPVSGTRSS